MRRMYGVRTQGQHAMRATPPASIKSNRVLSGGVAGCLRRRCVPYTPLSMYEYLLRVCIPLAGGQEGHSLLTLWNWGCPDRSDLCVSSSVLALNFVRSRSASAFAALHRSISFCLHRTSTSHATRNTSLATRHMSHVICHTSRITSHITRHTCHMPHDTRHASHFTCHMSHVTTRHTSCVTRHVSHVTGHVSHVPCHITCHTSPRATRHVSQVTCHTSHGTSPVTQHTSRHTFTVSHTIMPPEQGMGRRDVSEDPK